ncbi:hypothetical protein BDW02DRAFT_365307 [Decorospora gaudefroyi]|uniref:Uncharacterized protein n=1 Tax=Decorospora gaudefroyi TaxID=184978 RepID=A0A6A5KR97_9PLEO|nr:hypothetical protein BDW02DRAFT_365307 [Decorospora gaudefroyi]
MSALLSSTALLGSIKSRSKEGISGRTVQKRHRSHALGTIRPRGFLHGSNALLAVIEPRHLAADASRHACRERWPGHITSLHAARALPTQSR